MSALRRFRPLALAAAAAGALAAAGCTQLELLRLYTANEDTQVVLEQPLPLTLPFREDNGWIIVQASVDGSAPVDFVVDTGASMLAILTSDATRALPLDMRGLRRLGDADDLAAPTAAVQPALDLDFGPLTFPDQTVLAIPLDTLVCGEGIRTPPFAGVIGHELFSRYVVEVDYDRGVLVLHDPATYEYRGDGEIVPTRIRSRQPFVTARVQGPDGAAYDATLHVDSGAGIDLSLFPQSDPRIVAAGDREGRGCFVGGLATYREGSSVQLGFAADGARATVPAAYATGAEVIDGDQNGRLGSRFLRRYNVVFDYSRERMILAPRHTPVPADPDAPTVADAAVAAALTAPAAASAAGGGSRN